MTEAVSVVAEAPVEPAAPARTRSPIVLFFAVALVLAGVVWFSGTTLRPAGEGQFRPRAPADDVLGGWLWFDAAWYVDIAEHGYFYAPGQQSSVAYFPAYPTAVRAAASLFDDAPLSAIVVTFASGLLAAALFWRWSANRMTVAARRLAFGLLLVYPYAWFLYGAGYADAVFLAATIAAFVLLESDRPLAAGLAGAVATAARPVGIAVGIGLIALAVAKRRRAGERLRGRDAGVLFSFAGIAGWCAYLALRFGDPFAFASVQGAPGWDRPAGPYTWFKLGFFERVVHGDPSFAIRLVAQAALAIVFIALLPAVARRLGMAYAVYSAIVIAIPFVGTDDFHGMGRYLLASFPTFAVAGAILSERRAWVARAVTTSSFAALVVLTSMFARGYYLT